MQQSGYVKITHPRCVVATLLFTNKGEIPLPATIQASEKPLGKVFSDEYRFEVPRYQRPYAWEEEQVDELLDDLLAAMERDPDAPYFLGSIVLIKDENPRSQIVDGQQRLTTLTMLMCVLRDLASPESKSNFDHIIVQKGKPILGIEDEYRVTLRELDRDFFRTNVQASDDLAVVLEKDPLIFKTDSQRQIYANIKRLRQTLSHYNEEERFKFASFIGQKCFLVIVSTSDIDSAYRIFSVMNDRGLDLSPTDILKAEIIGGIPEDSQSAYASKWEETEVDLGRDEFRDLFAHIRTIYKKDKLRTALQSEFRTSVLNQMKGTEFVDNVLVPYANAYAITSSAVYEGVGSEKINPYLRHLSRLDNFDWIPPLMAFLYRNVSDSESVVAFVRRMERLAYGLFIRRADVNERIRRYAEVIRIIEQDGAPDSNEPLDLSLTEKAEILDALNGPVYLQTRVVKPLLLRLDSILTDAGAQYDHPIISIEHVLPQNPSLNSQWMQWFSDPDERREWTHKIANLVLLSRRKNSSASNYEFEYKKSKYFQVNGTTNFVLTTQVVNQTEWTPTVLKHRQSSLIAALKAHWNLG